MQYLIFYVENNPFAVELQKVERVIWAVAIKEVPELSAPIEGFIIMERESIPVVNLRKQLSFPPKPLDINDQFIIYHCNGIKVALWVDRVKQILDNPIHEEKGKHGEGFCWEKFIKNNDEVILIYSDERLSKDLQQCSKGIL